MIRVNADRIPIKKFAKKYGMEWQGAFWFKKFYNSFPTSSIVLKKDGSVSICSYDSDIRLDTHGDFIELDYSEEIENILFDMIESGDVMKGGDDAQSKHPKD